MPDSAMPDPHVKHLYPSHPSQWTPGLETHKAFQRRAQQIRLHSSSPTHHHCYPRMHPQYPTHNYIRPGFSPRYRSHLHPHISFVQPLPHAAHFHVHTAGMHYSVLRTYDDNTSSTPSDGADARSTQPRSQQCIEAVIECDEFEAEAEAEADQNEAQRETAREETETSLVFTGYEEPEPDHIPTEAHQKAA
ncbi:hypothetical protein PMIN06_005430 [Paraphaeosphaeria minitans]